MRIDKFLQVSRIIKRRAVAKEIVEKQRVFINNQLAKPSTKVSVGDDLVIKFGDTTLELKVLKVEKMVSKEESGEMYEITKKTKDD